MTVTSDRQTAYRQRKRAAGLVQLNIWCRPQDRDTIRAYAVSLAEGVTSDKPKVKPLPETAEELKAHAAKVKAETVTSDKVKAERKAAKPKRKRNPNPIPTRCTANPAQVAKVMNYHSDPTNPGADEKIYYRATWKLIRICDRKNLKALIRFHHPDRANPVGRDDVCVQAVNELNARKAHAKKNRPLIDELNARYQRGRNA